MRNISFALTTAQFLDGSKTVTRRLGWISLKPGDTLCAVEKSQGLKKGETVKKLGTIRVKTVTRQFLDRLTADQDYGRAECIKEGFPPPHAKSDPAEFVAFFCHANGCEPDIWVTRIEFERISFHQTARVG